MRPDSYGQSQALSSLGKRLSDFCNSHWDINGIWLIHEGLLSCINSQGNQTPTNLQRSANDIILVLSKCLHSSVVPDYEQTERLSQLAKELQASITLPHNEPANSDTIVSSPKINDLVEMLPNANLLEQPKDILPTVTLRGDELLDTALSTKDTLEVTSTRILAMQNVNETQSGITKHVTAKHQRIYHLSDFSELSIKLDQLLEKQGFDIEQLNSDAELSELLQALPADLIILDPGFSNQSVLIHHIINNYKNETARPLVTIQICSDTAFAAGVNKTSSAIDAIFKDSDDAENLVTHIDQLLRFGKTEQYRVLIVEDDRSQAMFAEGILRNAEISTKVLLNAENLLPTIEDFQPDLILMDLYLPNTNGIELTELIRKSGRFQNTPIVFLTGESNEEKQIDALHAGGDDYLIKPIRPRRLIAVVQNRIKRHRSLQVVQPPPMPAINNNGGMMHRTEMLDLLKNNTNSTQHALMFIELNGYNLLKERLGLTALENLLSQFASSLILACSPQPISRFGDGSFVMLYEGNCSESALTSAATRIRQQVMSQKFSVQAQIIEPRIQIGICSFEHGENTDILINTAERAARSARAEASGVLVFKPLSSNEIQKEEHIIDLLNNAEKNNSLSHIYQPIVAVAGSDEKQFQTLLRLLDENGQPISAADFIPIAEKRNLIINIDRWSISKAVSTISEQSSEGIEIKLFVNQSNFTLLASDQADWLGNLLKANKINNNSLVIEINHNDALLNQKSINEFCRAAVSFGIQFCLSRYNPTNDESNLLESLPLSYIKLSNNYTSGMALQSVRDQIKLLVDRAHRHGLEVIGHSVEDAQTAATLWMSGIDYIQGNLVQSANGRLDFGFDQSVL